MDKSNMIQYSTKIIFLQVTLLLSCSISIRYSFAFLTTARATNYRKTKLKVSSTTVLPESSFKFQNVKIAYTCQGGSDPDRPSKVNQDAYFIRTNITGCPHLTLVGVMDGHGKNGHILNTFLSQRLPEIIEEKIQGREDVTSIGDILIDSYEQVNEEARLDVNVPAGRSGTTCVSCIFDSKNGFIHVANVGDSRAIVGFINNNNSNNSDLIVQPLSIETTTKREEERGRIESGEGRIDSGGNVWYGPIGIAMTRCLGNLVMKRAGVICKPEITTMNVDEILSQRSLNGNNYSSLILLGTDGIFDVISNDDAISFLDKEFRTTGDLQSCSDALVSETTKRWLADLPFEVKVDDTTCVLIRFEVMK